MLACTAHSCARHLRCGPVLAALAARVGDVRLKLTRPKARSLQGSLAHYIEQMFSCQEGMRELSRAPEGVPAPHGVGMGDARWMLARATGLAPRADASG
jgi:hypothetical protein